MCKRLIVITNRIQVKRFYDAEAIVIGHIAGKGRHKGSMGAIEVQMECGKKVYT